MVSEFPLTDGLIYLNHAAVGPWPRRTCEAVQQFAMENFQQGARGYPQWLRVERALKAQLQRLINAPAVEDIALLKNTSEALSVVARGLSWRAGDNVVICAQEFPSNRIVWESLREFGVECRVVNIDTHGPDPEALLLAATDRATRLLSVSSVQYATGLRMDLARMGTHCRARDILFCVDAIQSLGVLPFDVQALHADFVVADGHKWLLGAEGLALFYCAAEWRERLRLHQYGWHMVERYDDFDAMEWIPARSARRFECGSPNMLGIHALHASLSLIEEIGVPAIADNCLRNSEYLIDLINTSDVLDLLTPARSGRFAGIVSFRSRHEDSRTLYARLMAAGVVCAARGGGVRFSPHFYTRTDQLTRALAIAAHSD